MAYQVEKYWPNFITCDQETEAEFYMWKTVDTVKEVMETECWKECIEAGSEAYIFPKHPRDPNTLRIMQDKNTRMYVSADSKEELDKFIKESGLPCHK